MSFKPMTVGVVPAVDLYAEELDRIAELLYTEALDRIAELEAALAERTRERDEARIELDVLREPVSPSNLRDLGEYLAPMLDEDRWPAVERLLNAALSERLALIDERDAAIKRAKAAEKDVARLDWLDARCARDTGHTMMKLGAAVSMGLLPPQRGPFNARAAIDADRAQELQR